MAVQDPVYDQFNYQGLLDRAVAPVDRLGQGELSIAQQQGQRMFELAKMQRENDLYVGRNSSELAERQRLEQLNRLQIKNEGAQAVFAAVKDRHPNWKPDPKKSVDENLASANRLNEDDQFEGFKPIADSAKKAQQDHIDLLTKAGAYQPPSQSEINQRVLNDPALASLLSKNSRGQQIADLLTKGATISDIEKVASNYWNSKDDRALILGAMQKASTDLSTLKQQNALQVAGAQGQLSANRVNSTNELLQNMIAKASPQLQARMAAYVGQPPAPPATPALNPSGLSTDLLPPGGETPAATTPPANPGAKPGGADDSILQIVDMQNAQNLYEDADARVKASSGQLDLLSGKIVAGKGLPANERADLSKQYLAAKKDNEKAKQDLQDALTRAQSVYHNNVNSNANFFSKVGYNPIGTNTVPLNPNGMNNGFSGPGQPAPVQPTLTLPPGARTIQDIVGQPSATAPSQPTAPGTIPGPNGAQLSPMHVQSGFNAASRLFGVDQPTLVAAHNYATSRLGMSEQQVAQLVTAAAQGDPQATQKVKGIIAASSGGQTNAPAPSVQPAGQLPQPDQATLPPAPVY